MSETGGSSLRPRPEALAAGTPETDPGRLEALRRDFRQSFGPAAPVRLFSSPGRVELGGNHTDHQHGRVLAAAIHLDMI